MIVRTPVAFPDPLPDVRDLLRRLLADRPEPYARGVTVSVRGPSPSGRLPHVQVASDGRYRSARLDGRATLRVLVWHEDDGRATALANLAEALLLASSSDSVRGFRPITGALSTTDPDTGEPLSYFTLTARLRPYAVPTS